MKIAVISDSHDNIWKLDQAMETLRQAAAVLHCGDLCAPFMVRRLGESLGDIPIHIIWGNNEGDPYLIGKMAEAYPRVHLHGPFAELELDGLRVAMIHYPQIARGLALSGLYDVVCYGHNHQAKAEKVGDCLLLNPGELMGMNGPSMMALLDSETRQAEHLEI